MSGGESHGHDGFTKVPKETLVRIARLAALLEVREMICSETAFDLRHDDALRHAGAAMRDHLTGKIDAMIVKEEG